MNPQLFHGRDSARAYYAVRTNQTVNATGLSVSPPRKPSFVGSLLGVVLFFICFAEVVELLK